MFASQVDEVTAADLHVAGAVDPVGDREEAQLAEPDPQEPHEPPQQPPPPVSKSPELGSKDSPAAPANAKLETSTRVFVDSQLGHGCALSRSANCVRSSNLREQLSQRYS